MIERYINMCDSAIFYIPGVEFSRLLRIPSSDLQDSADVLDEEAPRQAALAAADRRGRSARVETGWLTHSFTPHSVSDRYDEM